MRREMIIYSAFDWRIALQTFPDGTSLSFDIPEAVTGAERSEMIIFTQGAFLLTQKGEPDGWGRAGVFYEPRPFRPGTMTMTAQGDSAFYCFGRELNPGYPGKVVQNVHAEGASFDLKKGERGFVCAGKIETGGKQLGPNTSFEVTSDAARARCTKHTMLLRGL